MATVTEFIRRRFRWVVGIPLALVTAGVIVQAILGIGTRRDYGLEYLGWVVYLALAAGVGEASSERRSQRRSRRTSRRTSDERERDEAPRSKRERPQGRTKTR